MDVPSMVQRSGGTLIVRSVVSGNQIYLDQETGNVVNNPPPTAMQQQQQQQHMQDSDIQGVEEHTKDEGLPQCKIKRNYSCSYCTYFTQNPRYHLTHLRDVHGEKIVINKCKLCLYASRHYQKLVRHMKMVHGSTEGIAGNHGQQRKRNINRDAVRKRKTDSLENGLILQSNLQQQLQQQFEQQQQKQVQQQIKQQLEQQELQQQQQQALLQFTLPKVEPLSVSIDDAPQNRLLKCSLCDFTTLYRAQLVDHEQEEHCRTKFFRCDKCTYVTHIKARFSKHVKYHSMPMIKCVTCDFRTPYKWNLDRHMKNHGGVGPFRCAACDFTADIKQSLTVHEMNHHVPPVGHAAGMSLARRRNKVGGTDNSDDYLSDPGDVDDHFNNNNNNIDDIDENYAKRCKYDLPDDDDDDKDQPTDLSQKGGGSDAGSQHHQKKPMRPVPNLIPIQSATNAINLTKEPTPSRSSFKELASLYFEKDQIPEIIMQMDKVDAAQLSPSSNHSATSKRKATSSSFFDELKSFADESARKENLSCNCGHVSKCLSESFIHRKTCNYSYEDKHSSISPINLTVNCSGSTRCQHCRHRCKSSADLLNHLKNCSDAGRSQNDSFDSMSMSGGSSGRQDHDDDGAGSEDMSKHPMENRVFVWNKMPGMGSSAGGGSGSCGGGSVDGANGSGSSKSDVNGNLDAKNLMLMGGGSGSSSGGNGVKNEDNSYYGVETAPGYGEVTKKMTPEEEAANSSLKKVYKCPHCSFWASTASRFHVHIVGHLNKKPFECSLCAYRSNWRWDITKHIRLKTIRDPTHKNARVLMNDETGRRNYTKYNKYITLMKVTDEDGDPKLMKSGEMTPNQVASLAFLNDFNKSTSESVLANGLKSNHSQDGDSLRERQLQLNHKNDTTDSGVDTNGYMRLPFLVINAALAQQKEQQEQLNASAGGSIKRSPPPLIKPSDDLITDIKTEGQEKKKLYKCRKCHFRHANRDAALAHVKIHCQEQQMPFASPSKSNHNSSLQASVNPTSAYMNKVLAAAMCLSQNQQLLQEQKSPNSNSGSSNNQHNQHSTLSSSAISASGSGLQQAISPKALAAIQAAGTTIEHGEITDEASSSIVIGGSASVCDGLASSPSAVVQASNPTVLNATTSASAPTASNNSPSATTTTTTTAGGTSSSFIGGASNPTTVVMGLTTTSSNLSNDSNERREPSPFRCGHCHQVSNWKHVIQRHCRLKHSGDIRIETLDRNSNAPVYRPLAIGGNGQSSHGLGTAESFVLSGIKSAHSQQHAPNKSSVLSKDDSHPRGDSPYNHDPEYRYDLMMNSGEMRNKSEQDFRYDLLMNNSDISRMAADRNKSDQDFRYDLLMNSTEIGRMNASSYSSPSNKSKQQKCPSCPYISESKSQMNYHISLHKPTQYECNLCSYVCTKKQHLSNHVKAMHESSGLFTHDAPAAIDLRSKQSHDSDDDELSSKVIAYCPKCPTRFVNSPKEMQLHLNAHAAGYEYHCEACDFSAKQETILLSHSFVHTSTYQEKTEQAAKNAKEDAEFSAKKMKQITLPKTGATVWVVADPRDQTVFNGDGSLLKKQLENGSLKESASPTSSASPSLSSISEINEPEKCAHCPFQSIYSDTFKRHLQCHISVSNKAEKYTCEHCDFSTPAEGHLAEHTPIHFDTIEGRKSVAFFTSYDNLELIVTDDDPKKADQPPKPISFSNDTQTIVKTEKTESTSPDLRRSSRSSAHNGEEKSSPPPPPPPPPPSSSHKTILVNPKTGQVIRRN